VSDTLLGADSDLRAGTARARTIAPVTESSAAASGSQSGSHSGSPSGSSGGESAGRQAISYCPYCAEETLFPREAGGWECRSCLRAFSVTFLGLVTNRSSSPAAEGGDEE
jgi:ribosomal protein L37AE/L43A